LGAKAELASSPLHSAQIDERAFAVLSPTA
jgi:hypothetical protein